MIRFSSVKIAPTFRLKQVDRAATAGSILTKYSSQLGLSPEGLTVRRLGVRRFVVITVTCLLMVLILPMLDASDSREVCLPAVFAIDT